MEVADRRAVLLYLSSDGYSAAGHVVAAHAGQVIDELVEIVLDGGSGSG